ncbi:toll/interleukin-1 receptor domain-containing protein [Stratiformator vulcanicus]|uniref:TIR domain-containing protein n=1 Tax=Stratiformator vulcanicus TaxID=2527980 RepID=A0A517R176_9PLAN|nr:toll/interleukin-1 receptor domain-containing protein [Stratiformator vulcanicus]QDT37603.1 hypothetical protein Pan189_19830 [Stratiformator vulcanicus]
MSHIFVSYRREDSNWATDRLIGKLRERFGQGSVFHDIDSIEPGHDFRDVLEERLSSCSILLVVVGAGWANATDRHGKRRLTYSDDWVRVEIETALSKKDVVVIPVVLRPAVMPQVDEVPASLADFCFRQELAIFPGSDFEIGFSKLVRSIDRVLRSKGIQLDGDRYRMERGVRRIGRRSLKIGVFISLATVFVIVAAVFALTRGFEFTGVTVGESQQASEADRKDLDRVVKRFTSNPIVPRRESSVEEREVLALGRPDYSNFEIRFDERIWSFQHFDPKTVTESSSYVSAMISDRTLLMVKTSPVKQLRFQSRTTGKDLVFSPKAGCPPSHVESDGSLVDTGIFRTRSKHLCFDVSQIEINEEFSITYRTIYWDAEEEEEPWFGAMSYAGCLRMRIIAIGSEPSFFRNVERKKCSSFDSPLEDCHDGVYVTNDDDSAFLWNMPDPEPFKIYMFFF